MRHKAWRWLGSVLGTAVLLLVVHRLYLYRQDLQFSWRDVSWPMLALSSGLFLCAQMLFGFSWHRLLADHGGATSLRGDFSRWCVTLAGKYLPGKVWQGLARIGLYHRLQRKGVVAPAFLREMLLSISAALTLVAVHALLDAGAPEHLGVSMSLAALLLLLVAMPPVGRWLLEMVGPYSRFSDFGSGGSYAGLLWVWMLQVGAYVLLGLGFVALAGSLMELPPSLILPGIAALCFAGVAGIAAFIVPAGIGVREAALVWYLSPFIGPGPAALLAIAARVWLTVGELFLVALGLWLMRNKSSA